MTADRAGERAERRRDRGAEVFPPLPPVPEWPWVPRDRAEVRLELFTLALSVPGAPMIIVMVTAHDLPRWWLIVAGVLIGWASDAVTTLFGHCMGIHLAQRTAAIRPPGGYPAAGNGRAPGAAADPRRHTDEPPHQSRPQ